MRRLVVLVLRLAVIAGVVAWWRSRAPLERRDRRLRRLANERLNPAILRRGLPRGAHASLGVVEHVGRASGTLRRTPVHPIPLGNRFALPLAYGERGEWPRNVLAAGCCRLEYRGDVLELVNPRVMAGSEIEGLPGYEREIGRLFGGRFLVLDVANAAPKTEPAVVEAAAATPA